ncbi:MAG: fructosamine kinase family protein [Pseudomonadales bacterium]
MQQQFARIAAKLGAEINHVANLSGGSISAAYALHFNDRPPVFAKHNSTVPADFFSAEATGLQTLARHGPLRVPEVLHYSSEFIVLEFIESAPANTKYWHTLGEGLAELHKKPMPCFGFEHDNYCGSTAQPNPKTSCGYAFFGEQRLLFQAQLAYNKRRLTKNDLRALETLLSRLPELIPAQPPCLIHGDLWSGNVISDEDGDPVLIDPAAHWGWAEADIAMTLLFGGFAPQFYRAYEDSRPLAAGWRARVPLYNLYHLLNHLNLFGAAYYHDVSDIIHQYQ